MKDRVRLHEIERELDKTDVFESPPYRNSRRKLNREKKRILLRLSGGDPNWFSEGAGSKGKDAYGMKKGIMAILAELKSKET